MNKILSIIIPRYRESKKTVMQLLTSINNQNGIDFNEIEVIISQDGPQQNEVIEPLVFNEEIIDILNFPIQLFQLESNKGPGMVRQYAIDNSTGKYIMFCDADDIIHSVGVLDAFLTEIKETGADMIMAPWMREEIDELGNRSYIIQQNDNTWLFGKVFKREFLVNNNIRFVDDISYAHEDSYFNSLVNGLVKSVKEIQMLSYLWKYNQDSITHKNNRIYYFETADEWIKAVVKSFEELEKRGFSELHYKVCQLMCYTYFITQLPYWNLPETALYREKIESTFKEKIEPFYHYFKETNIEFFTTIYCEERAKIFNNEIEMETFVQWLMRLGIEQMPMPVQELTIEDLQTLQAQGVNLEELGIQIQ